MPYYLGLSLLSTNQRQRLSGEARRILSLFEGRPIAGKDIARESQGRPFFPGREVDFNIAHSGALAAVSYRSHVIEENLRTGCDVEQIRPRARTREIAEEFFSAPEKDYIFSHEQAGYIPFDDTRFFEIWTLKECFLKLRGLSVFDMAACPSFVGENTEGAFAFNATVNSPLSFYLYVLSDGAEKRYILATAIEGAEHPPEIRWFSHLSLDCKKIAEIKAAPSPAETVSPKI